jgi:glucose-1-phosphate adenylyltransferase
VADGCVIDAATIKGSVVGLRSIVGKDALVESSIVMGADYYEAKRDPASSSVGLGIGAGSVVRRAILDKNARIGERVRIENKKGLKDAEGPGYLIQDGIVIVCKNAVIPPGTVI